MKGLISILIGLCLVITTKAQSQDTTELNFSLLRQNDQLSVERDAPRFYPGMKSIGIGKSNLSFGGSYRGQYEVFQNEDFQEKPGENGWWLQRVLMHSKFETKGGLHLFLEMGYSDVFGKPNLAPVDKNELYVNQGFVQYTLKQWSVRAGRDNVKLGTGRLVDPREGPNVRRSFDQVSITRFQGVYEIQGFYSIPVMPNAGVLDDDALHGEEAFWGLYTSRQRNTKGFAFDFYYLGLDYKSNQYNRGVDRETRHSLGVRLDRAAHGINFDNEFLYQFGSFGDESISAWTLSFHLWRNIRKFRTGLKSEVISGDNGRGSLNTFNAIYPRGAYFGRVARFGPSNLIDIHPYVQFRHGRFYAEMDYDHFWRYSTNDGIYDPALNLLLPGDSDARNIAGQFGMVTNYTINQHLSIELEANYIMVQDYIRESVKDARNVFHSVFTLEARF